MSELNRPYDWQAEELEQRRLEDLHAQRHKVFGPARLEAVNGNEADEDDAQRLFNSVIGATVGHPIPEHIRSGIKFLPLPGRDALDVMFNLGDPSGYDAATEADKGVVSIQRVNIHRWPSKEALAFFSPIVVCSEEDIYLTHDGEVVVSRTTNRTIGGKTKTLTATKRATKQEVDDAIALIAQGLIYREEQGLEAPFHEISIDEEG